tara:strand:+ start:7656 stop:7868 length:213 start_codon:yes stop_codon:yes gene_type:complete
MEGYGWLNTLYDLSIDGVFTHGNKTAINSVMDTNLYEVFTFLSWKSSKNEYENTVRESMEQEAQIKQRKK